MTDTMLKDDELIKKYHLDEVRKRMSQISEYTFITKPMLSEDDDEPDQEDPIQDMEGSDKSTETNTPDQDMDGNDGIPQNNVEQNADGNGDFGNEGFGNEEGGNMEEPNMSDNGEFDNIDTMQEGDEVIDVDDLTKTQDVTQYKIDGVDDKLTKLLYVVDKFVAAIDQNDKKIDDLKAEFEKRNPTQEEQMNLRSLSSGPFSVNPTNYFKTQAQSNYNIISDNNISPQEELYVFKKDDLKNINDMEISKTFDDKPTLSKYVGF